MLHLLWYSYMSMSLSGCPSHTSIDNHHGLPCGVRLTADSLGCTATISEESGQSKDGSQALYGKYND